jgi:Tol biopolymer transport system component
MARGRTPYLPALVVAGVLVACAVAVLGLSEKAEATFPGKNGRIAYMGKGGIYTIYPGGGDRAQLTHNRGSGWPSYSPNGKKIVYKGWDGHDDEIYTMNAGGGGKVQLTNNNGDDWTPSYSPDGKKIIYAGFLPYLHSGKYYETEIYMINVGGGGAFNVTDNNIPDGGPSWGSRP